MYFMKSDYLKENWDCLDSAVIPKTELQQQILSLRKEGLSMCEIAKQLHCSKGTVSYNLRSEQRLRTQRRNIKRGWLNAFNKRLYRFKKRISHIYNRPINKDWKMKLRSSTSNFQRHTTTMFGYKDVLKKYDNSTIIICYLTGDVIDLTKDNFAFDHIIPISKGGKSTLDNLGITTYEANAAKNDKTEEEFVELCKKVLIHHGYKVEKLV